MAWANERKPAAPKGNIKTQRGQDRVLLLLYRVGRAVPSTTANVPAIRKTVSVSPNSSTPNMAANRGVVEVKVDVSVGPRRRTEISVRLAEISGRNNPTAAKIRKPVLVQ